MLPGARSNGSAFCWQPAISALAVSVAGRSQNCYTQLMKKPVVLIPMGDPAGIGPEIVVKALADEQIQQSADCTVIGDRSVLEKAASLCGCPVPSKIIDLHNMPAENLVPGKVSAECGKAAYQYIEKSIQMALDSQGDVIATPPVNKESFRAAGVPYIGHTEIFAALTETPDPLTLFEVRGLRVFFLSRHVSLRKACDLVTKERIIDYVRRCKAALKQLGVTDGVMAVAGLNPHSGEHGLFGDEEMTAVVPAVEELKADGIAVEGPVSADSVFHLALTGRYNSVLSLYHDQGHIATKTLDFERTISITCGMPVLRTSVDHGTAFDIAWQNKASAVSMKEAILLAAKYARI